MASLENYSPLGKVGLVNKGVYNAESNSGPFSKYDFVQHGTNTYMATQEGVSGEPSEGAEGWQVLAKGVTGTAAKITNVTASVTENTGVPSASVKVGGTDTDRTLDFTFDNLKGETGVGIKSLAITEDKHLEATMTDQSTLDAGAIELSKEAIVDGLGYEPPVNDTQGVNLLTGTKDFSSDKWVNPNNATNIPKNMLETEKYLGFSVISRSTGWNWPIYKTDINAKAGETYTMSAYAKADSENTLYFGLSNQNIEGSCTFDSIEGNQRSVDAEWKRYVVNFKIKTDGIICAAINSIQSGKVYICGYKLERGTVTDPVWTPAPEDILVKGEVDGRNLIKASDLSFVKTTGTISSTNNISIDSVITGVSSLIITNKKFKKGTYTVNINGNIEHFLLSIQLPGFIENNVYKESGVPYYGDVSFPYMFTANEDFKLGFVISKSPQVLTGLKMEIGYASTQYTPAPEDVLVSGEAETRNLLLNSNTKITTSEYNIANYDIIEDFEIGTDYTITIEGQLGANKISFDAFVGGVAGDNYVCSLKRINEKYIGYIKKYSIPSDSNLKKLMIYGIPRDVVVESSIDSIKLEKGINPNPHWTPAPEDVTLSSELTDVVNRISELEIRNTFIRIIGNNGDTFAKALNGKTNRLTLLVFSSGSKRISDNPFSFLEGIVLAFNSTAITENNRFLLFGLERLCSKYELKFFTINTDDESSYDMGIN